MKVLLIKGKQGTLTEIQEDRHYITEMTGCRDSIQEKG